MNYEWVIGTYEGEEAKLVTAHANAGVGYYVIARTGRGAGLKIKAAFRRACDSPTPHHLELADYEMIVKLEKLRKQRSGISEKNKK